MTFVKLHHSIFHMGLSARAVRTWCAMLRFMNRHTHYANVRMEKLKAASGLSEGTLRAGIRELQSRGLLEQVNRHGLYGYRLANGYRIHLPAGGFTKMPVEQLALPVTSSGWLVYAWLLKCADQKQKAYPSLRQIACAIGVTVKTVCTQLGELVKKGLVSKLHYRKRDGSYGHNRYTVSLEGPPPKTEEADKKEERTRLHNAPLQKTMVEYVLFALTIISYLLCTMRDYIVKNLKTWRSSVFFSRVGYCKSCGAGTIPTGFIPEEENTKDQVNLLEE